MNWDTNHQGTSEYQALMPALDSIEAILFDLDGTLIDTDDMAVERLARNLKPIFGHRATSLSRWLLMQSETPGNYLMTILDKLGLDLPLMTFTDRLRKRRGVYPANEFRLVKGVAELIPALRSSYRLGIVTTRSRYHIERFLSMFPMISSAFEVTCGLQDSEWLKPNPQPIFVAAESLNLPVTNCLMVGDTAVDMKAGRRAGAWTVGVLCGFGRRSELERAGAHVILDSTADLGRILEIAG
jgi:phosphoglycolate phosphatase-like HAD superfamily hydrolase